MTFTLICVPFRNIQILYNQYELLWLLGETKVPLLMNRWTNRWMDGWMDGSFDAQLHGFNFLSIDPSMNYTCISTTGLIILSNLL